MKKIIAYISITIYSLFWTSLFIFLSIITCYHFSTMQTNIHASMMTMQMTYNMTNIITTIQFILHLLFICLYGTCILLLTHVSYNKLNQLITYLICYDKPKERKN